MCFNIYTKSKIWKKIKYGKTLKSYKSPQYLPQLGPQSSYKSPLKSYRISTNRLPLLLAHITSIRQGLPSLLEII